ncbi:MAG TPA: CDP-alcohol phosphatidyltransferase family protein [Alphaproteobacteria bacterium]|jgi:CDP-diacylglycerol--glycerol-3-phosphate 3-phosphatidyltransferase
MLITASKPYLATLLLPAARALLARGVSPNAVTVTTLALSCATGAALALSPTAWVYAAVPVVLGLRLAFNVLDGIMARRGGCKSKLGVALNELGDIVADGAIYLPFALSVGVEPLLAGAFVLLCAASEAAGLAGHATGAGRRQEGPLAKGERGVAIASIALLVAAGAPPAAWIDWAIGALALLTLVTVARRVAAAARVGP